MLDPADLGLALALAGRADQAVAVLEPAARAVGADARTRQNLALAYALGGDWQSARTIASQDLPADQLDARMEQWLTLAKPGPAARRSPRSSASTPAASDPGQPTRLALYPNEGPTRVAQAAAGTGAGSGAGRRSRSVCAACAGRRCAAVASRFDAGRGRAGRDQAPLPMVRQPRESPTCRPARGHGSHAAPGADAGRAAPDAVASRTAPRRLAEHRQGQQPRRGPARRLRSRDFIAAAWNRVAGQAWRAASNYTPVTARFDSAKGTFYRLSVKGFASDRQAIDLCTSLKRAGANCFVRAAFSDAPVQFASR